MITINLEGKKAVILGVANHQSIAWHIAQTLNRAGASIALGYQERAEASVEELVKSLNNSVAFRCDVTKDEEMDGFFQQCADKLGAVDFLIHSIAFAKKNHLDGKSYLVDKKGFQIAHEVSAYSLIELTRRALPIMNDNGGIIAISYYGAQKVVEHYNVMGVAKAALESAARYLAADVGERGIRVNVISAGPIKTLAASGIKNFEQMWNAAKEKSPLKRAIDADDVAYLALFLCSDLSKNITGQTLYVDAGYSVMGV
jgi:enoyl-[acyl-carrier protein] reductase I